MKIQTSLLAAALGLALSASVSAASMSASQAESLLARRGFSDVSMLHSENGLWMATATDEKGQRVDVRIDPVDEKVTSTSTVTTHTPAPVRVVTKVVEKPVYVDRVVEQPVYVDRVVEQPVIIERVIEQPVVRSPIIVRERVLVPAGGKISKDIVVAVLEGAGYHDVHDIDWLSNRGVWKAEARDATGDDREVHVDPYDARIVHVEND